MSLRAVAKQSRKNKLLWIATNYFVILAMTVYLTSHEIFRAKALKMTLINKGESMTKNERTEKIEKFAKIISIIALTMLITSSLYTIYTLRPENGFMIENIIKHKK